MTSPATRRRAEAFAAALEGAPGGRPALEAGADGRAASEMGALLTLARALPAVSDVTMAPESRDRIRRRLVAVAAVSAVSEVSAPQLASADAAPAPAARRAARPRSRDAAAPGWRRQRAVVLATGVTAVLLVLAMVGVGGSRALPGDPLYRLRTLTETVQLATTFGDLDRGKRHLGFATTRLHEVRALVERAQQRSLQAPAPAVPGQPLAAAAGAAGPPSGLVADTLARMSVQTVAGTRDLTEAWRSSGDTAALTYLTTYTTRQFTALRAVVPMLPPTAQPVAARSLTLLVIVNDRATRLRTLPCDQACRDGASTTGSGAHLESDPLGALPCTGTCTPAKTVAKLGVPKTLAGGAAKAMAGELLAVIQDLPPEARAVVTQSESSLPALPSPTTLLPSIGTPGTTAPDTPAPGGSPTPAPGSPDPPSSPSPPPSSPTDPTPSSPPPSSETPQPPPTETPTQPPTDPAPTPTDANPPSTPPPSTSPAETVPPLSGPGPSESSGPDAGSHSPAASGGAEGGSTGSTAVPGGGSGTAASTDSTASSGTAATDGTGANGTAAGGAATDTVSSGSVSSGSASSGSASDGGATSSDPAANATGTAGTGTVDPAAGAAGATGTAGTGTVDPAAGAAGATGTAGAGTVDQAATGTGSALPADSAAQAQAGASPAGAPQP